MGDGNEVLGGIVGDGVDAGHFLAPDVVDAEHALCRLVQSPALLAVQFLHNGFGQGDGRSRRGVQLVYVVRLHHVHVVLRKLVHDACQIAVHGVEDGYADTEVARPEEGLAFLLAGVTHFLAVFLHPSRRTAHHLHSGRPGFQVVVVGCPGGGELDGYIGTAEGFAAELFLVVYVYDAHNLVTALQGYLLYHAAHFSVSNQCYFHLFTKFFAQR